ncbi:hypothetical protein [Streptomyces sp. NPDC059479]|uniref:hypothetical protein n=1 Tax=Streptomyces sp. NPDC059479 TaxID=3346848 RepID=UPI0036794006
MISRGMGGRIALAVTRPTRQPSVRRVREVEELVDTFLDAHGDWEKWRTWSDETTHAIHESQTLCIERVHEASVVDEITPPLNPPQ